MIIKFKIRININNGTLNTVEIEEFETLLNECIREKINKSTNELYNAQWAISHKIIFI
jgi:hypothetical protein